MRVNSSRTTIKRGTNSKMIDAFEEKRVLCWNSLMMTNWPRHFGVKKSFGLRRSEIFEVGGGKRVRGLKVKIVNLVNWDLLEGLSLRACLTTCYRALKADIITFPFTGWLQRVRMEREWLTQCLKTPKVFRRGIHNWDWHQLNFLINVIENWE